MVDQNAPHRFRRGGEEVAAVVEVLVADQTQVRLVDQGGGVEGVPGILAIRAAASFRSSSYTSGSNCSAAWRSPCSMAERMRVTSFISAPSRPMPPRRY